MNIARLYDKCCGVQRKWLLLIVARRSLPSSSKLGAVPELVTSAITITCLSRVGGWRHRADYDRSSRFSISVDALRSRRGGGGDGLPDDRGWIAWEEESRQRMRASWLSHNPMSGGVRIVNEEGRFSDRHNHTLSTPPRTLESPLHFTLRYHFLNQTNCVCRYPYNHHTKAARHSTEHKPPKCLA